MPKKKTLRFLRKGNFGIASLNFACFLSISVIGLILFLNFIFVPRTHEVR